MIGARTVLALGAAIILSLAASACSAAPVAPVPASPVAVVPTVVASGSPTPAPPVVNPCALVSAAEVQEAFGGQVGTSQLDLTNTAIPTCTWPITGSRIGTGTLRLAVTGMNGTAATFESMRASFPGTATLTGVGQQAFSVDSIGQVISFNHGTTLTAAASGFVLDGADPPRADTRAVLSAVSRAAAARV